MKARHIAVKNAGSGVEISIARLWDLGPSTTSHPFSDFGQGAELFVAQCPHL